MSKALARSMNRTDSTGFFVHDPSWAIDYAPNGTRVGEGDILTRRRYANLLENIGENGADIFYTGAIANATVHALQAENGIMTLEDLQSYKVAVRKPVQVNYRDYKLISCGAPSSGATALQVMNIIAGYQGFGDQTMTNLSTHRFDEAIRFGYGAVNSLDRGCTVEPTKDILSEQNWVILPSWTTWMHTKQEYSRHPPPTRFAK